MRFYLKKHLDHWLYRRRRAAIRRDWKRRHRKVLELNPDYRYPAPRDVERRHMLLWSRLGMGVKLDTLRVCYGVSGEVDPRIVPEEVFASDIDRCLNHHEWAPFLSHKSLYTCSFPKASFVESHFHCIGGQYFDDNHEPLTSQAVEALVARLPYPVVLKPNTGTSGGEGVRFPDTSDALRKLINERSDFVVQPKLGQHPFFQRFSETGLNTIRVYTYRSVMTEKVHVLNCALRMGRDGSLDNETAGGIVCAIHPNGKLHGYAVDKYAVRYREHPNSHIVFEDAERIPFFDCMKALCADLAPRIPMMRLAGWDMTLDADGRWRVLEVNLAGHTIRFSQYAGKPFFGEYTEEVVDYCARHPRFHRLIRQVF